MAGYESPEELRGIVQHLVELMKSDEAIVNASKGSEFAVGFTITDFDETFILAFKDGEVEGRMGADIAPTQIKLSMDSETFDGVFSGEVDPMGAAMSGRIAFGGDLGLAMNLFGVVDDLRRIYAEAKTRAASNW